MTPSLRIRNAQKAPSHDVRKINAQEGRQQLQVCGANLLFRPTKTMISSLVSEVNGPHEEWAERHCRSARGVISRFHSLSRSVSRFGKRSKCAIADCVSWHSRSDLAALGTTSTSSAQSKGTSNPLRRSSVPHLSQSAGLKFPVCESLSPMRQVRDRLRS